MSAAEVSTASPDGAPDYAEPWEAWRLWRVVDSRADGLVLASMVKACVWPAREPVRARCLARRRLIDMIAGRTPHDAPEVHCTCGVYGTSLVNLPRYLDMSVDFGTVGTVIGRVALWGTVVECEHGVRATIAYPMELYVPRLTTTGAHSAPEVATALRRYGVPVQVASGTPLDLVRALARAS